MDTEKFLKEAGVKFEKHTHETAYTAQELAAEEHVSGDTVAKTVAVHADDRVVLCILPASYNVDLRILAKGLGAKKCRLADEKELTELFPDVEVGTEPPFGKPYGLETVVDEHLAQCQNITFKAGTYRKAIRMAYADYARLAEAKVLDFSVHL